MATQAKPRATSKSRKPAPANPSTGAMIASAAAGLAIGLMANLGRKAAVQAPTALAGQWDEALAAEHAAVMKLFDALQATGDRNTTRRAMLLMQLKHALAKHAIEEENVIYPALRDAGQAEQADHLNHDHGYVKQFLYDLENMPKDSPAFLNKVADFRTAVQQHASEEENTIFPALKARLSEEQNRTLTFAMNKEGFKLA